MSQYGSFYGQPISRQDAFEVGLVANCKGCGEECPTADMINGRCPSCEFFNEESDDEQA